ncbi:hypothetical protein BGW42_005416, partial [Actinomortierella wolfii]
MPSLIKCVKSIFKSNSKKDARKQSQPLATSSAHTTTTTTAPAPAPVVTVTQKSVAPAHPKNGHEKHTLAALLKSDAQLAASGLADSPYAKPASNER